MSKQQTAVEFIIQQIKEIDKNGFNLQMSKLEELAQQAIQMEREQIETAYIVGIIHPLEMEASKQAKQYFNDTYGTEPSR